MTAPNHALTGALIGLTVGNPVVAISLAVLSHFACDAIPHFGRDDKRSIGKNPFALQLIAEAMLCLAFVLVLGIAQPANWLIASVCAFAAAAPDLMWIPMFVRARRRQDPKPLRSIWRFHAWIQWFQRPIGSVIELAWATATIVLLAQFVG